MPFNATEATVENEGCNLHYWYQGSGPLLIMIPGGSGHAAQFFSIFEYLDKHFTICTYDRRQMSASTVKEKAQLNPAQSARDAEAITKAMGKERASIFGNSGGGIIAFQFAVSYPDALDHVMVHEARSTILLDDATYHLDRAFMLMELLPNTRRRNCRRILPYRDERLRGLAIRRLVQPGEHGQLLGQ